MTMEVDAPDYSPSRKQLGPGPSTPSSAGSMKRKADELERAERGIAGAEDREEEGSEKEKAKRRKKEKKRKRTEKVKEEEERASEGTVTERATGGGTPKGNHRVELGEDKVDDESTPSSKSEKRKERKKGKEDRKSKKRKHSDQEVSDDDPANGRELKQDDGDETTEKQPEVKKAKKAKRQEKHHTPPPNTAITATPKSLLKKPTSTLTSTPRTKSVTFAPDAKSTDGDSMADALHLLDPSPTSTATSTSTSTSTDPTSSPKPQITYLLSYYQARSSWKFSKNKQKWILRNIWNMTEFDSELLQSALWAYVNGLASQGSKDRLLGEAKKVAEARRKELGPVNAEDDAEYRRAKLVLTALGEDDIPSEDEDGEEDEGETGGEDGDREYDPDGE